MSNKIIPEGSGEYRRWELPQVESRDAAPGKGGYGLITADQLARIQEQAFKEAQQQGHAQGYRDGLEQAQKEMALKNQEVQARLQRFESLLRALSAPFEQLDEQVEQELFALAVAIARQIIRRELKADPGEIVATVREAVAALPGSARHPHVYLHPDDAAFIRQTFSLSGEHEHWKLIDDPSLTRGDCRVTTDNSRVDASVENRLAAIVARGLGGEREEDRRDS
jgi:flagellar assembly protein FliH